MAAKLLIGTDLTNAASYSPAGVPVTGDDLTIAGGLTGAIAGVDQSAVTLNSLTIYAQSQSIGSPTAPWKISATTATINVPPADGSSGAGPKCIAINLGSVQSRVIVANAPNGGSGGYEPVLLAGTHAANELVVQGGTVGVGTMSPGQASTFATVTVTGGVCRLGTGLTLTNVVVSGGKLYSKTAVTLGKVYGGEWRADGTGLLTTVEAWGGTASVGVRRVGNAISTLNMRGGIADFSVDPSAYVVAATSYRAGTIKQFTPAQGTFTAVALDFASSTQLSVSLN